MQKELKQQIDKFYNDIQPLVAANNRGLIQTEKYRCCLAASLVKSYEFNSMVAHSDQVETAFFQLPALRSLCEDFIYLKFLGACLEADREKVIAWLMMRETAANVKIQEEYFGKTRPFQRVLGPQQLCISIGAAERKLKEIAQRYRWELRGSSHFPSVSWMAKECGLAELYKYIYDITSDWVHFSPATLVRMGWGKNVEISMEFSTRNFSNYYQAFALIYGTHLFCQMIQAFPSHIALDDDAKRIITEMEYLLSIEPRWPEIVTFEEMNLQPPGMGILEVLALSLRRVGKQ